MPEQFENPEAVKVDDKTASDETAKQRIDRVAEKMAVKPAKVEQKFDKENGTLFTK
jgi:hypothetical protein